jgi:hypothetical protein
MSIRTAWLKYFRKEIVINFHEPHVTGFVDDITKGKWPLWYDPYVELIDTISSQTFIIIPNLFKKKFIYKNVTIEVDAPFVVEFLGKYYIAVEIYDTYYFRLKEIPTTPICKTFNEPTYILKTYNGSEFYNIIYYGQLFVVDPYLSGVTICRTLQNINIIVDSYTYEVVPFKIYNEQNYAHVVASSRYGLDGNKFIIDGVKYRIERPFDTSKKNYLLYKFDDIYVVMSYDRYSISQLHLDYTRTKPALH